MKDLDVTLLNAFHDHGFMPDEVVAVEVPFTIDIADPDTGVIMDVPLAVGEHRSIQTVGVAGSSPASPTGRAAR